MTQSQQPARTLETMVGNWFNKLRQTLGASDLTQADSVTAIHQGRRGIKRLRAALKLLRMTHSRRPARKADRALRGLSRLLSPTRDADVRRQVWERLNVKLSRKQFQQARWIVDKLNQESLDARAHAAPIDPETVRQLLDQAGSILGELPWAQLPADRLIRCFIKRLRRTRRNARDLDQDWDQESAHDLRKQVKTSWAQFQLLRRCEGLSPPVKPAGFSKLAADLGEERDVHLLETWLDEQKNNQVSDEQKPGLNAAIKRVDDEQKVLRRKIHQSLKPITRLTIPSDSIKS